MGDFTENTDIKLEKRLINNLPEHYREHDNVQQLFSALGKYLDELREEIHNVQYYNDWAKNSESNLIRLSEQYGVDLPRNLSRSRRRQVVRDAVSFYQVFGTEPAIRLMFRLIGWDVEIEYIFIESGQEDQEFIYPADYYFGNDFVDPDDGKIKANVEDQTGKEYNKCKIYGEKYNKDDDTLDLELIRCPYIKVTITAEDYDVFTEDYEDDDGNVYSYTESEQFEIIQSIINYFRDVGRPANVAIIELATPYRIRSRAEVEYEETSDLIDGNLDKVYDFVGPLTMDSFWTMDLTLDFILDGQHITDIEMDDMPTTFYNKDPSEENYNLYYSVLTQGLQSPFHIRKSKGATIKVERDPEIYTANSYIMSNDERINSDGSVDDVDIDEYFPISYNIRKTYEPRTKVNRDEANWYDHGSYEGDFEETFEGYTALKFNFHNPLEGRLIINITQNS